MPQVPQGHPPPSLAPVPPTGFDLSVVVPAFNEERRLGQTLDAIRRHVLQRNLRCELVVVDDGSSDGTAELVLASGGRLDDASQAGSEPAQGATPIGTVSIRLLRNPTNRGKGFSVRRGMLAAQGRLVLMCDADMSTPIAQVDELLPWTERGYAVVIGSRDMPESRLDPPQPLHRRLLARMFRFVRRRLMLADLRDTQCGFKLFTRPAAQAVFTHQQEMGWAFDCEVLAIARQQGLQIKEVGVLWRNDPDTRVRALPDGLRMLRDLWRISRRLSGGG